MKRLRFFNYLVLVSFCSSLMPNLALAQAENQAPAETQTPATANKRKYAVIHVFDGTQEGSNLQRDIENRLRFKLKEFGKERSQASEGAENIERYKVYSEQAVSTFSLPNDQGMTMYQPVRYPEAVSKVQTDFLNDLAARNEIDVIFLGSLNKEDSDYVLAGQLYDKQNGVFTKMETTRFQNQPNQLASATSELIKRLLAYVDPEGWVNTAPFFDTAASGNSAPTASTGEQSVYEDERTNPNLTPNTKSLDYHKFDSKGLAGDINYAGEEPRFWEQWWFWTIVGTVTAAGVGIGTYYLLKPEEDKRIEIVLNPPSASGGVSGQ